MRLRHDIYKHAESFIWVLRYQVVGGDWVQELYASEQECKDRWKAVNK